MPVGITTDPVVVYLQIVQTYPVVPFATKLCASSVYSPQSQYLLCAVSVEGSHEPTT